QVVRQKLNRLSTVRLGRLLAPRLAHVFEQVLRLRVASAALEKLTSRLDDPDLFGDSSGDELIQRYTIFLGQSRRRRLHRRRQLQRVGALAHFRISFSTSRGSSTLSPKSRVAGSKSRRLCVTSASAAPLTAVSNTSSSFGSES